MPLIKELFTMCTFLLSIQVGCPEPKRCAPGVEDEEPRLIDVPRSRGIGWASDAPSLVSEETRSKGCRSGPLYGGKFYALWILFIRPINLSNYSIYPIYLQFIQFMQFIQFQVLETVVYPWVRENYEDANICYLFQQVMSKHVRKFESKFLMFLSFRMVLPLTPAAGHSISARNCFKTMCRRIPGHPAVLTWDAIHFIKMSMTSLLA